MNNAQLGSWEGRFLRLAARALGLHEANRLQEKYRPLLTDDYQHAVAPHDSLNDILHLERIATTDGQCVSLLRPDQRTRHYRLHFYSRTEHYLDEYIPLLENAGLRVLDQVRFRIALDGMELFIKSFTVKAAKNPQTPAAVLRGRMLPMLQAVIDGKIDNDALNKLSLLAGMDWPAIDLLRAYRNYYLQLGHRTTKASLHHALVNHPEVSRRLFDYFETRFRPDAAWNDALLREEQAQSPLRLQLLTDMNAVADINDDRILRTLFNLIDATVRSNFHNRRGRDDYFIAFKIDSLGVIDMPTPRPQYEIYVHAIDMEGIHLRGGKISRGGIRWSDRHDDFRTEILGLMQTQISKNALIIPTGAKGGFIVKNPVVKKNGSPQDWLGCGKNAYIRLMQGLLDLTDNYREGDIVRLDGIVAYDDPDPYLVVAADKGTATFSDIANGVAADYRFWLGDAYASGGSRGYDHKALGITARGAWECVKRHFRELGKDIQTEPFTVVGIGSMDGDVFGNGMLLSHSIRLRAAFSGQHIFIDPNPADDTAAFNERRRLFDLPGSSWANYDGALISAGGGVYARSDKDIPVSAEVKKWLGIRYRSLDGETLIRYLLTAPVDLLWLGGIGTYIKASTEKHEEVGDRNNDNVRIDAAELQALVVGEGANLGFTQKARIEYALRGGRINTDAVDNSAGVDTSDHEVNLKILLMGLQKKAVIADYQALFTDLTAEVSALVLANNQAQSLCLSLEQQRCKNAATDLLQAAERLETSGFLDRAVESFPTSKDVLARSGYPLTRPELAVLMAAAKRYLSQRLAAQTALLQTACCTHYLKAYFPQPIATAYREHLTDHPLADAIKATLISNKIVNQAGSGFLNLEIDNNAESLPNAVACYLSFDRLLDGPAIRNRIHALDNTVAADRQYALWLRLENSLQHFCRWALTHGQKIYPDPDTLARYGRHLAAYRNACQPDGLAAVSLPEQAFAADIPDALLQQLLFIDRLGDFLDIVELAEATQTNCITVLTLFNKTREILGLDAILAQLAALPCHDRWERTVLADLKASIQQALGALVKIQLSATPANAAAWLEQPEQKRSYETYRRLYQDLGAPLPVNLLPYVALDKQLNRLVADTCCVNATSFD